MINVALCTDNNYASHCAICVTSILENNKKSDCCVYIITDGLSEENTSRFKQLSNVYAKPIRVIKADISGYEKLPVTNHLGRSMYFRFLLPDIVDGDKVLYLDCDIIVRHSLEELFDVNLDGVACGVVEDQNGDDLRLHNPIMMFSRYFNSGVLLMNLDYWRQYSVAQQLIEWIKIRKTVLMCPDQDALNVVLENRVVFLDYKYNFQQGMYTDKLVWLRADKWPSVIRDRKDPIIVHFTAGEKPWHKDCAHPLLSDYDYYMSLYPFLAEEKTLGHKWYFYLVESVINKLKGCYHWYRRKNGMIVNEV